MDVLIADYEFAMCPPPCVPGAATWGARAALGTAIEAVLPYLNARLEGADYDHQAKILIWKDQGHRFAFRSQEIKAGPALDREEGRALIDRAVALANEAWRERDRIEPCCQRRVVPNLMQVYRLLPRTNCGRCGCPTCMAFAGKLREGQAEFSQCPLLDQPEHADHRALLQQLLQPLTPRR